MRKNFCLIIVSTPCQEQCLEIIRCPNNEANIKNVSRESEDKNAFIGFSNEATHSHKESSNNFNHFLQQSMQSE